MPTAESPGVSMVRGKKEYQSFCGRERGKRKTEALAWVLVRAAGLCLFRTFPQIVQSF